MKDIEIGYDAFNPRRRNLTWRVTVHLHPSFGLGLMWNWRGKSVHRGLVLRCPFVVWRHNGKWRFNWNLRPMFGYRPTARCYHLGYMRVDL